MKLELKPFDFAAAAARAGLRPDGLPIGAARGAGAASGVGGANGTGGAAPVGAADFRSAMSQALRGVSDAQNEAAALQREVQLGNPAVGLEQTMIAMQKSSLGFQAAVSVRGRLVQAYTEIMNMQV